MKALNNFVNNASLGRSKVLPGSLRASRVLPVPTAAAAGQWHALRARPARFKAAPVKRIAACALPAHPAAVGSRCARLVQPVRIPLNAMLRRCYLASLRALQTATLGCRAAGPEAAALKCITTGSGAVCAMTGSETLRHLLCAGRLEPRTECRFLPSVEERGRSGWMMLTAQVKTAPPRLLAIVLTEDGA